MNDEYAAEILEKLKKDCEIDSRDLSIPSSAIHGVLLSLQSKNQITFEMNEKLANVLTAEGEEVVRRGSPEYRLYSEVTEGGADVSIIEKYEHGAKYAFKNRWISQKDGKIFKCKNDVKDDLCELLADLSILDARQCSELKKRRLIEPVRRITYKIKIGEEFGKTSSSLTELTADLVAKYSGEVFKKYNFDTVGNIPSCGSLHPLMKIREEFKRIFLEMGFGEMDTDRYVESSFWNFDTLFQPQNHPSRDIQDTFFIKNPELATASIENSDYFERVKSVHEHGGYGSVGHRCPWSPSEAMKNVLRTHTTAVSARRLSIMAKDFKPAKLFSIDKVFRNESIDATHLAEFHQVEGVVAGYGLGLGHLMGIIKSFYEKLGLRNLKFKPAFNPYTEPSMEVFGYHEGLKRWIEIGNSGIFRPEMLRPMGFDEDVVVLGWGLSLERPAMIKYGLDNIRDLVGHRVDIDFIKKSEFIYF